MRNVIEPWGVYVPFIYSAVAYWSLGAMQILLRGGLHPIFMMDGAYLFYVGMMFRLFAPARKYVFGHLVSLILLLSLTPQVIGVGMGVAFLVMMWAVRDVRKYGSKFPINYLVLISPLAGAVSWLTFNLFMISTRLKSRYCSTSWELTLAFSLQPWVVGHFWARSRFR